MSCWLILLHPSSQVNDIIDNINCSKVMMFLLQVRIRVKLKNLSIHNVRYSLLHDIVFVSPR